MTIEEALVEYLESNSTLRALVGTNIYPQVVPPNVTGDTLVYNRISGMRDEIMGQPGGVSHHRIQIDCWSDSYSGVRRLANELRYALNNKSGQWGTVEVQCCMLIDEGDNPPDYTPDNSRVESYSVRQDYEIWHSEEI